MQRIYACPWNVDEYLNSEGYLQVVPDTVCPHCQKVAPLHRHGLYERWVISLLGVLRRIPIARFLCYVCRHTISYLPEFALTYRLLGVETFEAFLNNRLHRPDVQTYFNLLQTYRRRLDFFAPVLFRTLGSGLGMPPPAPPASAWPWLKKAGERLAPLTRRLTAQFRIGLFLRYQCHQPARL